MNNSEYNILRFIFSCFKFTLEQATKTQRRSRGKAQRHAPAALLRETDPAPIIQKAGWTPGTV